MLASVTESGDTDSFKRPHFDLNQNLLWKQKENSGVLRMQITRKPYAHPERSGNYVCVPPVGHEDDSVKVKAQHSSTC